jgi:hypothetical protein
LKTVHLPTRSALGNVLFTSARFFQVAFFTIKYQADRDASASGCSGQNSLRARLLMIRKEPPVQSPKPMLSE